MPVKPMSLELMAALDVLREKKRVIKSQEAQLAAVTAERDGYARMASESDDIIGRMVDERDALAAKLAEMEKRIADAPKTHAQVKHTACWIDADVPQYGRYALLRLEDGET